MYRHSLRKRVAIAFAVCVAVLSVVWGFAFFAAIKLSEDRVMMQQLAHAAERYPAITTNPRSYTAVANLPESLRDWARENPNEGTYEFTAAEFHVAVIPAENELGRAFVVFDVTGIEAESHEDWWWLLVITAVVGTLGILGFVLGVIVMRRAVAPVVELADVVAGIDLQHLSAGDHKRIESRRFGDDEVGMLADTIEKTLERISAFIARERYFTGSASHELRTPITVISGALELLEHRDLSAADVKVLDRIRRATQEMNTTIEMFLCLARETDDGLDDEQFMVMPIVNQAVEQQCYLLNGKHIDVDIDAQADPSVLGHPQAFSIAVNNLVRNAFEHAFEGQGAVTIAIRAHELIIINPMSRNADERYTPTETPSSHGYGLGLGIVERLCERNGWSFSLKVEKTQVSAQLAW